MQRESNWRYWLIFIVLALCLIFIYPTIRYAYFVTTTSAPTQSEFQTQEDYESALQAYNTKKRDLLRNAISLGLDLIGGVDVTLSVDDNDVMGNRLQAEGNKLADSLREQQINFSMNLTDSREALEVKLDNTEDARQFENILKDFTKNIFRDFNTDVLYDEGLVRLRLQQSYFNRAMSDTLDAAKTKIENRVNAFGLTQPSISVQEETHSIVVQIPGERNPKAAVEELIQPAQLEFYPLYKEQGETVREGVPSSHDQLVRELFPEKKEIIDQHGEKKMGWVMAEGKSLPDERHQVMFARELTQQEIMANPELDRDDPVGQVYIVTKEPYMTGEHLRDAWVRTNTTSFENPIVVSLEFGGPGITRFYQMSSKYYKNRVAIALDEVIYSAPVFQSKISDGAGQITGRFDQEEARRLAMVLKAGALPTRLKDSASRQIGPTLGSESIVQSSKALLIGAVCITVFMVVYYGAAGVISILALILNILVILGCLDMFNATLTLSGIGGMILTLGMAVDANVLIYERIREELDSGTDVANAIRTGFGQAFSVILDSNLTTLLAAFVLLQFGQGSVRGFALTMAFGLLANLFTGLTVTYALCRLWFNMRGKFNLGHLRIFHHPNFNFLGARKVTFVLSALMVIGSIGFLGVRGGPDMAVDFQGGLLTEVEIKGEGDQVVKIGEALEVKGLSEQAKVQAVRGTDRYLVRLALLTPPEGGDTDAVGYTKAEIERVFQDEFGSDYAIMDQRAVSEEVGQSFQEIAIMVVIAASICILLYLWFRFELVFGIAAVIALVHDLTITLGVITLLDVQISLDIISALLILLGFSVNDTIVIFDRVRENSHSMFGRTFKEVCNAAMNQSLSRTVITSVTTVGVMLIMFFFGGRSLAPFALTLIVGGIIGTYSSDFVAAPFVYWFNKRQEGKLMEHLGRKGQAVAPKEDGRPAAGAKPVAASGPSSGSAPRRGRR